MANDLLHRVMEEACCRFGGHDGVFNAAGFSQAMRTHTGLQGGLDGQLVRALLTGRDDVEVLHGGSHYRLRGMQAASSQEERTSAPSGPVPPNRARDLSGT